MEGGKFFVLIVLLFMSDGLLFEGVDCFNKEALTSDVCAICLLFIESTDY